MLLLTRLIPARRPDIRSALLAVLVVTGLLAVTDSPASDRDTPAYRIYVDPVTGRYSTKSPDQQAAAARNQRTPPAAVSVAASSAGNGTLRRPLIAALLLVAIAAASLLARVKQPS